jgi:kumamolisin
MPTVPRGYRELAGSRRGVRPGARQVGPADPQESFLVSIYVRPHPGAPPLPPLGEFAGGRRRPLTRAELNERYAASAEDLRVVTDFAESAGLTVVETSAARRLVQVSGTAAEFARTFAVDLARYESPAEAYRGHEGPIQLPGAVAEVVEGVFGLDNRRMARRGMSNGGSAGLTPPQVAQAYDFPAPAGGANGQTVAILEFSGPTTGSNPQPTCGFTQSDIDGFIAYLNQTTGSQLVSTDVTAQTADGMSAGNSPWNADIFPGPGPDIEVALDIEVVVSVAQQAAVVVYFASNSEQGWVDALSLIATDTGNDSSILSISYGWPELEAYGYLYTENPRPWPFAWSQQAFNQVTQWFQLAAAIGMTVLAASGDFGSDCHEHDGNAHVWYPASDPGVISCGGTRVNSISPLTEGTWNDSSGVTGGGISYLAGPVAWQAGAAVPPSVNPDHHQGRGLPDVAGNASPASGYTLWFYGQPTTSPYTANLNKPFGLIGGTSAVAPLYASLIALINATLNTRVGWLNPTLYDLGGTSVFRDINDGVSNAVSWQNADGTIGASPGYTSRPGWDACTGWGSIDGSALLTACRALPPPPLVISGRVVDNESWTPISDAVIAFTASSPIVPGGTSDSLQLSTDSSGNYETPDVVPQDYTIVATADGYSPGYANVTVRIGVPVTAANFALGRLATVIAGRVTDTALQPIKDATLLFSAAAPITPTTGDSMQLSTDANGQYQTPDIPPQFYQVTAIQDGFANAQAGVTVSLGVPVTTLNFVLVPPEPFTVKGIVWSQAGKALKGVTVTLEPAGLSATTDDSGVFAITGMPDGYYGDYMLTAALAGFMPCSVTFTIPNGATVIERLVIAQLGSLSGTVTNAVGSAPIAGATVTAGTVSGASDPAGAYSLASLDPGDTSVAASAPGFDPAHSQVWIVPGADAIRDITMTPASAVVFGTVALQDDSTPLANATVVVAGLGAAHTDHTGSYTISHVPAGNYDVTASADRCRPATVSIQVMAQHAVREDFGLFPLHEPKPIGDLPNN